MNKAKQILKKVIAMRVPAVFWIITIAILIRMAFFISLQPWKQEVVHKTILVSDARGYERLARSILDEGSFEQFQGFRTPGYPLFIAMIYMISSGAVWLVILIQIMLSSCCVYLVYKIASVYFSHKVAVIAGLLASLDIFQALYAVTIGSDILFLFLFLISVKFLIDSIRANNLKLLNFSALFAGLATLVRPVSYIFPLLVALYVLIFSKIKINRRVIFSLVYFIVLWTVLSPWILHNYFTYGTAKLTSQAGTNLLFCNVAATEAYRTGKPLEQVISELKTEAKRKKSDTVHNNPFVNEKNYKIIARKYIRENFVLYCRRHIMGIINMYSSVVTHHFAVIFSFGSGRVSITQDEGPNIFKRFADFIRYKPFIEKLFSIIPATYLALNYLLAFAGSLILLLKKDRFAILLIMIVLYFSLITGVIGNARLRVPIVPFINISAAFGLVFLLSKMKDWADKKNSMQ